MTNNITKQHLLRKLLKVSATFFYTITLSILISSCHKSDGLGDGIINSGGIFKSRIYTFSNFTSETITDTLIGSDEASCELNYLGSYTDSKYGRLDVSFMTQFNLANRNSEFDTLLKYTSFNFDSVCLQLAYGSKNYGEFSGNGSKQRIKIFALQNKINSNTTYNSNTNEDDYVDKSTPLFDADVICNPKGSNNSKFLRIKLPTDYFDKFLYNKSIFNDSLSFHNVFKGLYFSCISANQTIGSANIVSFDLKNEFTKLKFFHRTLVAKSIDLSVLHNNKRINIFKPNITLETINSDKNNIYIQGYGYSKGSIYCKLNELFKDSTNISIINAEIEIRTNDELMDFYPSSFPSPSKLLMKYIDESGNKVSLKDEDRINAYNTGGTYNTVTKSYHFNISRTLQYIINSHEDIKGFFITCADRSNSPSKIILKGDKNIKLTIKYTKF